MISIGPGVREIRVRDDCGAFRVIYIAGFADAIYVLHAFRKKTQRTARQDLSVAMMRLQQVTKGGSRMSDEPIRSFASVWDAIEETPEEAAHMRLRAEPAVALRSAVEEWQLTQAEAARRLGVTQPRLNDLLRGRVARFSLDGLVGLAERSGLVVHMQISREAA